MKEGKVLHFRSQMASRRDTGTGIANVSRVAIIVGGAIHNGSVVQHAPGIETQHTYIRTYITPQTSLPHRHFLPGTSFFKSSFSVALKMLIQTSYVLALT